MKRLNRLMILFPLLVTGCTNPPADTLFQVSTLDALAAGVYDGSLSCRSLLRHGDFGTGTFHELDGELTVIDGKIFQVKSNGKVYEPDLATTTPFASICTFRSELGIQVDSASGFSAVKRLIDEKAPNQNLICAVRIKGQFQTMRTRSVPLQNKPYPPLVVVAATQPEFNVQNVSGTIVGFRFPPFMKGMNLPGYHLHFISSDGTGGGHILDFTIVSGTCEIDILHQFSLILPKDDAAFAGTDLAKDRSQELMQAEGSKP